MIDFWLIILTLVFFVYWVIERKNNSLMDPKSLAKDYFVGLNYLLNEENDKAVTIFMKLLEVDKDTIEMHLALGSLFRKRGEVDRAIKIHQNLIERPQLLAHQRHEALLALGRDYLTAGFLDRAERVFLELVHLRNEQSTQALGFLLDIYQQEKEWDKAIDIARKIQKITLNSMETVIAHLYCEKVENFLSKENIPEASKCLKAALETDKTSIRANLLEAKLAMAHGNYKDALYFYQKIVDQDIHFLAESLQGIMTCYEKMGKTLEGFEYLKQVYEKNPNAVAVFVLIEEFGKIPICDTELSYLLKQLKRFPSFQGMIKLITNLADMTTIKTNDLFSYIKEIGNQLIEKKSFYQCENCGFSGKTLHWHCPGCKQWDSVKPLLSGID